MRAAFLASLALLPFTLAAYADQDAGTFLAALSASAPVQAACPPINRAVIGNQTDRTTWVARFGSIANASCLNAVQAIANALPTSSSTGAITSTSFPALNGTYSFDGGTLGKIVQVSLYIQVNNRFPDGLATFSWPDANGVSHSFATTASFLAFATAMIDYATAVSLGQIPAATIAIP